MHKVECERCGLYTDKPIDTITGKCCSNCVSKYKTCNDCDTLTYELTATIDSNVCNDCIESYYSCEDCNEYVHEDYTESDDNMIICDNCYSDNYNRCHECDMLVKSDCAYSNFNDYNSERCFYCEDCYHDIYTYCGPCDIDVTHDHECESRIIKSYDYKPSPTFYGEGKLYYGLEIEIESEDRYDCAENLEYNINRNEELVYFKRDSSLNEGFEVVSHPLTYRWIMDNDKIFNPIFNLSKRGCTSMNNSTCGMHVHMSKKGFTDLELYKFQLMFYGKVRDKELIHKISQRTSIDLDSNGALDKSRRDIKRSIKDKRTNGGVGRYTAINFENYNTIEVRIFNGTLNKKLFYKNIQFLESLYHFTKQSSLREMHSRKYLDYVVSKQNEYRYLYEWLDYSNLLQQHK